MRFTYTPEKLRQARAFDDAEFEWLIKRARECLLWNMSPDYYDSMSHKEYAAWIAAWNQLQKEEAR